MLKSKTHRVQSTVRLEYGYSLNGHFCTLIVINKVGMSLCLYVKNKAETIYVVLCVANFNRAQYLMRAWAKVHTSNNTSPYNA